jgi:hypothetical protein
MRLKSFDGVGLDRWKLVVVANHLDDEGEKRRKDCDNIDCITRIF